MTDPDRAVTQETFAAGYGGVTALAGGLGEAELMLPSRCARWTVGESWDDATCALKGTGRAGLTGADRAAYPELAGRLPVLC